MVNWLVKKAERTGSETVVKSAWVRSAVKEPRLLGSSKLTRRKLTARFNSMFRIKSKSAVSRVAVDDHNSKWVTIYRYICQNYKDNWIKSIITLVIVTITLHYILNIIILFMEQTRKTMVSFYKWQFLSNVIAPSNTNRMGSFANITSWFQIIKNIVVALI
ncbi:hypothetical protein MOSE0_G04368 [Monosporozyma servazzii]